MKNKKIMVLTISTLVNVVLIIIVALQFFKLELVSGHSIRANTEARYALELTAKGLDLKPWNLFEVDGYIN